MPRQHQRRHSQPVRAQVKCQTGEPARRPAPVVAREQPADIEAIAQARIAGQGRIDRGAVELRGEAQRAGNRDDQLMALRPPAEPFPETAFRRGLAQQSVGEVAGLAVGEGAVPAQR